MPRVLVIIPTSSYRTAAFLEAAVRIGVEVAVASEEKPPLDLGDRFVLIDCSDAEAAARSLTDFADRVPVDAVVAVDDAGVVPAAMAARTLGLPQHSEKGARATRDKVLLRRTLSASEVPQPRFVELENGADPTVVDLPFPVIVKPRSGSASRGVMSVTTASGLPLIVDRVENIARSLGDESILVEEYIDGREVAVEGIASADDVLVLAIFDKPDTPSGPTFEETLFVTPAELTTDLAGELTRLTTATVRSLGLSHGPFHAEFRIADDGRPVLIEIAARSIGGLCGRSLRFGIEGATLEELILLAALGRPFPAIRQPYASGVMMLPVPKSGILRGVEGLGPARSLPGVGDIEITIPAGTRVDSLPEGDRYLGFIFATGPSAAGVAMVLRQARAALTVTIDPA